MLGLRGATTADSNTKEAIVAATAELLRELVDRNGFAAGDIAAVTFSATADLDQEYPAVAARLAMGWTSVALMCSQEMRVVDDQPRAIRVLILINTEKTAEDLQNVYLKGAANLRERGSILEHKE